MTEFARAVSRSTVEAFPLLLEISHPELLATVRLTNFGEDVISRGELYYDVPFDISLPDLARNEQGQMHLNLAAFAEQVRGLITSLGGVRPNLKIIRIEPNDPDVVVQQWPGLKILGGSGQGNRVTFTAASTVLHDSKFPDDTFDSRWPGAQNSG